ncbi:hypothetical protein AYI70_g8242 [Smittium culicis]|uniref:Uncharacterized protein n=1 Tax=Smittium culicis TaxID=133412 RepID=A0A1R1XGY5_9FUNG|nr:hypothetical protein AYI70_g8242 [Smittium culicis]
MGTHSGEKFGMSKARCNPIQMEMDKAIRIVANFGKSAAMELIRNGLFIALVLIASAHPGGSNNFAFKIQTIRL